MRVVFFGTPEFSAQFLSAFLADSSFDVVGVVCQPDEPVGRKKVLTAPPTKVLALANSIPVFQPTRLKDETFLSAIDALHADAAVIVAYGRILPKILLDRIPLGFVNVHPSLLPKYRGPSPMQAAIANGDRTTGITIMKIDEGMDTGPILAQESLNLAPRETLESLTKQVVTVGAPLLIKTLTQYHNGIITPKPQTNEGANTCKLLTKDDGVIDWNQSAQAIDNKIRAYTPWPGVSAVWNLRGKEITVKLIEASIAQMKSSQPAGLPFSDTNELYCGTAHGVLCIHRLQIAGKTPITGTEFVRGYLK